MTIKISEFEPIIRNSVYGRCERVPAVNGQSIDITRFIILERITEPSEDEVLAYLTYKVGYVHRNHARNASYIDTCRPSKLTERALLSLPLNTLEKIMDDPELQERLRKAIPNYNYEPGQQQLHYLVATFGAIMPYQGDGYTYSEWNGLLLKPELIQQGLGAKMRVQIQIEDTTEKLIDEKKLSYLLENHAMDIDQLRVRLIGAPMASVPSLVWRVYNGCKENLHLVPDNSEQYKDICAAQSLLVIKDEEADGDAFSGQQP